MMSVLFGDFKNVTIYWIKCYFICDYLYCMDEFWLLGWYDSIHGCKSIIFIYYSTITSFNPTRWEIFVCL